MTPIFRFTLNNTIAGSLRISEPGGWDEAVMKMERNLEFHSLVEFYDQPLTFYGQSSEGNGGLDYIREIERSQGPDAQITILIEISHDEGDTYTTVFNGLIDITSCKEVDFYKAEYGIIRNDFWQKFINRKSIPVNLNGATDLDGNAISVTASTTLSLSSQKIRQEFERRQDPAFVDNISSVDYSTTNYLIWGNVNPVLDEITQRFEYGTQVATELPTDVDKYVFKFDYAGDYFIDLSIKFYIGFGANRTYDLRWYYAYKVGGVLTGPTQIGSTESGTALDVTWNAGSLHDLSTTLTFSEGGAELYIYGKLVLSSASTGGSYFPDFDNDPAAPFDPVYTTCTITADTTYPDTTAPSYLVLNAVKNIVSKYTGVYPSVASDYLTTTTGCGSCYALTKGLHIRGYGLGDKPFYMSFDQWWGGLNPILNLGLGYVEGSNEIEIEEKSEFYDNVPILNLDYVNLIERSYDTKFIFKSVEIGYEKWSAESGSGIDDPQTKHVYRTRFKTVGEDTKILSKFYAASLGIEQTRRNRVEQGKDWRLDEDIMIIAVKKTGVTEPELNAPFSAQSGILNASTRYNVRITPARNLVRWRNFLSGCLKWYTDVDGFGTRIGFDFSSGEGNVGSSSTLLSSDCEYDLYSYDMPAFGLYGVHSVADNLMLTPTNDYLFVPIIYEFEYPLTWNQYKAIRDNRKKAIGVSRSAASHVPCFIMSLEYQLTKGKAKFTVMLGQSEPI